MHASHVLVGLIATVSAIDIYGYRNNEKCGGTDRVVCTNVNPGVCCPRASGNTWRAIGFQAIPTNWQIVGSGFTGGDCKNIWHSEVSNGRQNMCCGGYSYSGGRYSFASKKRGIAADTTTDACPASEGGCTEVAKASLMELEGAKYNLTALDEALYNEMVISYTPPSNYILESSRLLINDCTNFSTVNSLDHFENGANATDIPAKFDAYKIE